ncbi:MAG: helix-turn-helix domain-containing protein [Microbacterium sp.]|uniref:IclR family transcriptional regulator n=1 Tax=Microbacterium sp. TaxID=51671 RepID=UPI0039E34DAD
MPVTGADSLRKALRILDLFTVRTPEWGSSEVARRLELPVSTANRVLQALAEAGYLVRRPAGRYRLGPAAVRLGERAAKTFDIRDISRPVLTELTRVTAETSIFALPDASTGLPVIADLVDSPHPLKVTFPVDHVLPRDNGSIATVFDAFFADEHEPAVDPQKVRAARTDGYAVSVSQTDSQSWGVAAPFYHGDRDAIGIVAVIAPLARFSDAALAAALDAVRNASPKETD